MLPLFYRNLKLVHRKVGKKYKKNVEYPTHVYVYIYIYISNVPNTITSYIVKSKLHCISNIYTFATLLTLKRVNCVPTTAYDGA